MSVEENKAVVRSLYEAMGSPEENFLDYASDDVTWTFYGKHVFAGTMRGKQEITDKLLTPMAEKSDNFKFHINNLWGEGDTVIVEGKGESTTFDGRSYNNDYCIVVKVGGGKVVAIREYLDTELVTEIFGS